MPKFIPGQVNRPRPRGRPRKQPGRTVPGVFAAVEDADEPELVAPRAAEIGKIADRRERAERLTALLRDDSARGAETVAAARMLESMEQRSEQSSDEIGAPAPTTRAEEVVRLIRILSTARPDIRAEAIEIVGRRSKHGQDAIRNFTSILAEPVVFETQSMSPETGKLETTKYAEPKGYADPLAAAEGSERRRDDVDTNLHPGAAPVEG